MALQNSSWFLIGCQGGWTTSTSQQCSACWWRSNHLWHVAKTQRFFLGQMKQSLLLDCSKFLCGRWGSGEIYTGLVWSSKKRKKKKFQKPNFDFMLLNWGSPGTCGSFKKALKGFIESVFSIWCSHRPVAIPLECAFPVALGSNYDMLKVRDKEYKIDRSFIINATCSLHFLLTTCKLAD